MDKDKTQHHHPNPLPLLRLLNSAPQKAKTPPLLCQQTVSKLSTCKLQVVISTPPPPTQNIYIYIYIYIQKNKITKGSIFPNTSYVLSRIYKHSWALRILKQTPHNFF